MSNPSAQRYPYFLLFLIPFLLFACTVAEPEDELTAEANAQILVFPSGSEERLISEERIPQDNCDGTAEMSQTVSREHAVLHTMELGAGLTVSADGQAGVPGVGQVGVGTEVATHYRVGYGRQEAMSRFQTVSAAPRSHMQHTIQHFEIWETGEVLIITGNYQERLPYGFRRDFSIKVAASANIGCPLDGHDDPSSVDNSSPIVDPPVVTIPMATPQNAPIATVSSQLVNLVQNPGFENGTQGWEASDDISFVSGYIGQTAIQSAKTANTGWGWVGISQEISVRPGQEYIFTAHLNWADASQVHMKVDWYDDVRRETQGPHVMGGTDGTSGQWVQRGGSVIAPANARVARISIWHGMKNEQAVTGGVVQIDEVVFAEAP